MVIIILGILATYTFIWFLFKPENSTTMSFFTWLKFYEVAPDHWKLCTAPMVKYNKLVYDRVWYDEREAKVTISYLTTPIYVVWKYIVNKRKKKQANIERDLKLLGWIQEDTNDLMKKSAEEITKASNESIQHIKVLLRAKEQP